MKKLFFTFLLLLVNSSSFPEELPFEPGEKLIYDLNYKGVKIGKAELTFHGKKKVEGEEVYLFTFYTDSLYFKDLEKITAEKDTFLPLKVERIIKGLSQLPTKIEEEYDQTNFRIKIKKKTLFLSNNFTIEKSSPIHNAILVSYLYRKKKEFQPNEEFFVNLPTRGFKLVFKGKERISTPLGYFSAYLFEGDSSFKFWLEDSQRRLPLKIEVPHLLGYSLVIDSIEQVK